MNLIRKELDLPSTEPQDVEYFISRWSKASGTEKANYQLFLTELCSLLHLPQPEPASEDAETNAYVFERRVDIDNPDGSANRGFIDLYKRDSFVLEAKQSGKALDTTGWDKAMLAAHNQADKYVRALPSDEGRPPFIVVTDVGRSIELYAEFTRTGGTYVPYPDPASHRIRLDDLAKPEVQDRLQRLWIDPESLDASKFAAQVTREVSYTLAELAKSLEGSFEVERVAHFLKRCLFTMFAEDVGLIDEYSFTNLLEKLKEQPEHFADSMRALWNTMNTGGFEGQIMQKLPQFNGGLFKDIEPIPLGAGQIQLLIDAAKADWRFVEPAIFGTLLERALDPRERHKLGAHYTPRAYVERLVMPTIIDPLREQWSVVQAAAEMLIQDNKQDKALAEVRNYHHQLCETKILDPACGSGNFLYVALEHMKRLEGEVLNVISDLSAGQVGFDTEGLTVDPHQFLGIEINPRAAAVAELVLWIGYLQWHYRIHGTLNIPEPILRDFKNIECRDALIEYDDLDPVVDHNGNPVTIWDGVSYKESQVTGELVPDEARRTQVFEYLNPRQAEWPAADYILGNPPFLGAAAMLKALGSGYTNAIRSEYSESVPDSADFVMYWWDIAAREVTSGRAKSFGLITTNSLGQLRNRAVTSKYIESKVSPLSLRMAIPDHPWVDSSDGAAVRIAMTVGQLGEKPGELLNVVNESQAPGGEYNVSFNQSWGIIFPNLRCGADTASAQKLISNEGVSNRGIVFMGDGFLVDKDFKDHIRDVSGGSLKKLRPIRNGNDITKQSRGLYAIDFFGLSENECRSSHSELYQWVIDRVKPQRDLDTRPSRRNRWWLFAENQPRMRSGLIGLDYYFVTVMTAKHRWFQSLDTQILPDQGLIAFCLEDRFFLGVLSSRLHVSWALAAGGRLGMGNDPRYNNTLCFDTFPFPICAEALRKGISLISEKIETHRNGQRSEFPHVSITHMYNVMEKLRAGESLSAKEKSIHEQGLVSVLRELHDDLDRAVFDAYGWTDLGDILVGLPGATTPYPEKSEEQAEAEEELLKRLVDLNHKRAAEEANGNVRWLRPEYQAPNETQQGIELRDEKSAPALAAAGPAKKITFPKEMHEQIRVVLDHLQTGPMQVETLASNFKRKPIKGVTAVLSALEVLGKAKRDGDVWRI